MMNDIRLQVIPLRVQNLWDFKDTPDGDWSHGAVFWFISYLTKGGEKPSFAPWDEAQTERVLTLILPSEYI